MTELKFKNLTAKIDSHGAELRSLKKDGKEILWQGDPKFWSGTAPILFPICSGLKDDKYILNGNEYSLPKHGFAQLLDFEVEKTADNCAKFTLTSNDNTLKCYPYKFSLIVTFTLTDSGISIEYTVHNENNEDMYYSIGAHEGYNCADGIENYDVVFNKTESFETCVLDGPVLGHSKERFLPDEKVISLKPEYFEIDAIILENINSDKVSLVNRNTGEKITVTVDDFENLLIWTIPGAPYVCLEPWSGFPDYSDTDGDFTAKHSIQKIPPYGISVKNHTIHI